MYTHVTYTGSARSSDQPKENIKTKTAYQRTHLKKTLTSTSCGSEEQQGGAAVGEKERDRHC